MKERTKDILSRLSARQAEWKSISATRKLELLRTIQKRLQTEKAKQVFLDSAAKGCEVMGLPAEGVETRAEKHLQCMLHAFNYGPTLEWLIDSYQVLAGEKPARKLEASTRNSNGQVVVKAFPLLPSEKFGPMGKGEGLLFLDSNKVKNATQVDAQNVQGFLDNAPDEGAMVILGAGNHTFLTVEDCFHALFAVGSVVLVKHHPLRNYLDEGLRYILEPLFSEGYIESQLDEDFDRNALYSEEKLISSLHMTGGKATHDAIVWGSSAGPRNVPKLKVPFTSELGCVTPWIVTPFQYTAAELSYQTKLVVDAMNNNASSNCNAPKVIVVADSWQQKDEYIDGIVKNLKEFLTVPAYYPGSESRWNKFRLDYPDAKEVQPFGAEDPSRQLSAPYLSDSKKAVVLPWLFIEIELSSNEKGFEKAKSHSALRNEPFCPVVTIVTLKGTQTPQHFCEAATKLCNEAIFGSLSATVMAPTKKLKEPAVETLLDELKYGMVAVNYWSAVGYGLKTMIWGAYPGEKLDNVESGVGHIHNLLFVKHIEKCVVLQPCQGDELLLQTDMEKRAQGYSILADLMFTPSFGAVYKLVKFKSPTAAVAVPAVAGTLLCLALGRLLLNDKA